MTVNVRSESLADWQLQAQRFWVQGSYAAAADLYERAIAAEADVPSHYWHLGLLRLLQGQEAEAQAVWFAAIAEAEPDQFEAWATELGQILATEAERQRGLGDLQLAWAIRQHLREMLPEEISNLLHLVCLSVLLEELTAEVLETLGVIPGLQASGNVESELLLQALDGVLSTLALEPIGLEFAVASLPHVQDLPTLMAVILPAAMRVAHEMRRPEPAAQLLELYLQVDANNLEILGHLSGFYQDAGEYERGIDIARSRLALTDNLAEKVFSSHLVLRGLMSAGGYWQKALVALEQHEQYLAALVAAQPTDLHPVHVTRLFTSTFFLPYFRDDLPRNRQMQNQLAAFCQNAIQRQASQEELQKVPVQSLSPSPKNHGTQKPLKIGYLSHCMRGHSVGWLARWLFQHHDRDQVQLYGYFINDRKNDPLYDWYLNQVDHAYCASVASSSDSQQIAEQIAHDDIDILVDLDSITLDVSCCVLSLKPAPIQVTWLGWDASGIPGVDYFIADPFVLPDWADQHYAEKIWRLPQTYIAVDGFEVGIPSLRRDQLNIPADAIVYLSAQRGFKRHADTVRLQMQILNAVPNSYFLIKGLADQQSIQAFFEEMAEAEGVSRDRLRFLPETATESIHRANIAIADVVLDTYPYNGATTTLETLWMGVPLVTRVGEQFAARNSYTMLKNVGVEEGIAWSDEEYVEWGVRLGKDAALRQEIHWKLMRSRQTSPLWNAQQFTREMEKAYAQMWAIYHS